MEPIMFNARKHHLITIIAEIRKLVQTGESAFGELQALLPGDGMSDIYEGRLGVEEIAVEILAFLQAKNAVARDAYQQFLESTGDTKRHGHYTLVTLSDATIMTLRLQGFYEVIADPRYYVHIHPGRHSPNTFRLPTNRLKTAMAVYFLALCRQIEPYNLAFVNSVRKKLDLSPVEQLEAATIEVIKKFYRM